MWTGGSREEESREEARIRRMKQMNLERCEQNKLDERARLQRVYDREGLTEQLKEKAFAKECERAEDMAYEEFERKTAEVLRRREEIAMLEKKFESRSLVQEWKADAEEKKKKNSVEPVNRPFGVCAAQRFAGEDNDFEARFLAQQVANKRHFQVQKNEKESTKAAEKNEDLRYAQYEAYTAAQRMAMAAQEEKEKHKRALDLQKKNFEDARARKEKALETNSITKKIEAMEIQNKKNDPFLCGTSSYEFKGYSSENFRSTQTANQELILAKKNQKQQEAYENLSYHQTQSQLAQYEKEAAEKRNALRKQANRRLAEEYRQQAQVEARRRRQKQRDAFGTITPNAGYLAGFGASSR